MLIRDLKVGDTFFLLPTLDENEGWIVMEEAKATTPIWGHPPEQSPVKLLKAGRHGEFYMFPEGKEVYVKRLYKNLEYKSQFCKLNPTIPLCKVSDRFAIAFYKGEFTEYVFDGEDEVWV